MDKHREKFEEAALKANSAVAVRDISRLIPLEDCSNDSLLPVRGRVTVLDTSIEEGHSSQFVVINDFNIIVGLCVVAGSTTQTVYGDVKLHACDFVTESSVVNDLEKRWSCVYYMK